MRAAVLITMMSATPGLAAEDKAEAFWAALQSCWAVKDGALVIDQGWQLIRGWTPECGDCSNATQLWDVGAGLVVVRERADAADEPTCMLTERTRPRAMSVLPKLETIWATEGLGWIAKDLRRPKEPYAILLSCEPDVAKRKVAVVDASGGALRFSVTRTGPDHNRMCEGAAG